MSTLRQPLAALASDPVLPTQTDVVVIGGGIVGVAAGYFLARRGLRVALVEKGRIGAEQSSRNWGWCRVQGRDRAEIPLARESLRLWDEIGAAAGFRRSGVLYVSDDPAELAGWEHWAEQAAAQGIDSRVLTGQQVAALLPGAARRFRGGLSTASDGRAEPALAAPAIAEAARQHGATLHQDCAARGLDIQGGKVAGVITERGTIRAGAVLCAGGVWSRLFLRRHGVVLKSVGVRASVLRTSPVAGGTDANVTTPGLSFRRAPEGGYMVAIRRLGGFDLTPDALRFARDFLPLFRRRWRNLRLRLGRPFVDALRTPAHWRFDAASPFEAMRVLDPAPDAALLDEALARFAALFPGLGAVRMEASWAGVMDFTPDALPVISAIAALPGLFVAGGMSGSGFGLGPGAGHLAADLIAGDTPIVDPARFGHGRMVDGSRLDPDTVL